MAEQASGRSGRRAIATAQVLLVLAAIGLWVASRLPWVLIRTADGLGQPKTITLTGGSWSTALLPLALLLAAAAVAALALHRWPLRLLAALVAAASAAAGYLAISQWVVPDIAVRAADLAGVQVMFLVGSERRYAGGAVTLAAAATALLAAVLLLRSSAAAGSVTTKYAAPAARRSASRAADIRSDAGGNSERLIWDALDDGRDPTAEAPEVDPPPDAAVQEGR